MESVFRFRCCERGATMVEMALVMVAALVLILGMVQFAVVYWYQNTLLLGVEHAGRWAMINNARASVATDAATYVCSIISPGGSCTNIAGGGVCSMGAGQACADAVIATSANGTKMLSLTALYGFSFLNITGSGLTLTGQTTVPLD